MTEKLKVATWNMRGISDPHRSLTVKGWLHRTYPDLNILCLQELMADHDTISFQLNSMFSGGQILTDSPPNGWVNSTIIASKDTKVIGSSRKGDGSMSWLTIATVNGPLNVASIYALA